MKKVKILLTGLLILGCIVMGTTAWYSTAMFGQIANDYLIRGKIEVVNPNWFGNPGGVATGQLYVE